MQRVYKAVKTIHYTKSVKVFFEEVKGGIENEVKKLRKEDILEAMYSIHDFSKSIKKGDYFVIQG